METRETTPGRKAKTVKDAQFLRDNYIKLGKLGIGGFGTVWKGFRLADSRPVAIKEISRDKVTQWGTLDGQPVPMEAIFLIKLKRVDGVIRILDLCVCHDKFVIVMERPKRTMDLFDYITERRRLNDRDARHIFKLVFKIVDHCRRRSVFHGDLKDENILIDVDTKNIKLIDFGGAMTWTDDPYQTFLGTGLWGPPECNKREAFYPEGATVWSLGCLLHTMLSGDIPFKTKRKALDAEFEIDAAAVGNEDALDLIASCLQFDVEKRLTLDQVGDHPWIKDRRSNPGKSLPRRGSTEEWFQSRMQRETTTAQTKETAARNDTWGRGANRRVAIE